MRYSFIYCTLIILTSVTYLSCNQRPGIPSLRETFSKKDKGPFGSYVLYDQMELLYNRNIVRDKKENFEAVWQSISDTGSLYISVSKNLFLSEADKKAMLSYADNGNSLFISSQHIDTILLDSLGCTLAPSSPYNETLANMQYTSVKMDTAVYDSIGPYTYFYVPFGSYFNNYDTSITTVLGKNQLGKPDFIEVFYGKGKFYLHCEPRALSNYFLLQKKNYLYLQNLFAFTSAVPEHVYWDDYYNKRNYPPSAKESRNGLGLLLQYPAMARAFWLLLLLLVLYILFGGKRRQRIVTTIAPNVNTTVAFTETVGHLYLQKKDNRNIAEKMILYFQEHIRKVYYLNTGQVNEDFITTLSRKSNVPPETTKALFSLIHEVQQASEMSDQELLSLNRQIENFYKNKF